MAQLYNRTIEREKHLAQSGLTVRTIWECEYDKILKEDSDFRQAIADIEIIPPLNPRHALYGGRVNAMILNYKVKPGEKIQYLDVVSEYPFVNKTKRYPIGQHVVIRQNFKDVTEYFGLIQCKILPPRKLKIPILPAHLNGKLIFALCAKCSETSSQTTCHHSDSDRAMVGTWCTVEVCEALKNGYKVLQIYEIWQYDLSQEKLFADYIDLFLKLKMQASGWPAGVSTDEQKQAYLDEVLSTEGIQLNPKEISKNPGLRQFTKLLLNSFWGRLGMRENKLATVFINDAAEFFRYLTSSEYEIHGWDLLTEDVLQLTYTISEELVRTDPKTNIVLAAFTTAHARLHLLQFLQMAGDRLLYFDTDSIISVVRPGDQPFPTGSTLGMLTSELDPDEYIEHFCSTGPKSYSYVTSKGKSVCKVKGITLSRPVREVINFESMCSLLTMPGPQVLSVEYPSVIRRSKKDLKIFEISMRKKFQKVYTKRRLLGDLTTLPFGYCDTDSD